MFKVICIDNKNKPSKIPLNEWIVEGSVYTVRKVVNMALMNNQVGFELEEVSLSPDSFPYEFYSASRFKPTEDEKEIAKYEEVDLSVVL
jgi:hypothetical protein